MALTQRSLFFVTGASGFLGGRALEVLTATHPELPFRALTHTSPVQRRSNVHVVYGSLEDAQGLPKLLEGVHTVLHFAAATHAADPDLYMRVNATGTANLVRAAERRRHKRPFSEVAASPYT